MKDLKSKINDLPTEFFEDVNKLLKEKYGLEEVEATNIKFQHTNLTDQTCPPGKRLYCWRDINGKQYCKCI